MVKCRDCGLLAEWSKADYRLREAVELVREGRHARLVELRCFCGSQAFPEPLVHAQSGIETPNLIRQRLETEVDCDKFRQWISGRSPQEHHEMGIAEEAARLAAESRRDDRLFVLEEARRARRANFWTSLVTAIVGGVVSGALGGWLVRWLGIGP